MNSVIIPVVVEIGFIESEYTASESTGSLDVTIQLLECILDTQVEVQISVLSVASNLAEGKISEYPLAKILIFFLQRGRILCCQGLVSSLNPGTPPISHLW